MEERRKNGENGGEPVGVCRRVVGASVGLWMSPVNCVCVGPRHSCGITGPVDLLTKAVSALAGDPGRGLMANCGLRGMVGMP